MWEWECMSDGRRSVCGCVRGDVLTPGCVLCVCVLDGGEGQEREACIGAGNGMGCQCRWDVRLGGGPRAG